MTTNLTPPNNSPSKYCFILRGLPGSGKDSLVSLFLAMIDNPDVVSVINTDEFFIKDGKYHFDKLLLKEAHESSWLKFRSEADSGKRIIIVNNSNIKNHHFYHYLDYAQRSGYLVSIVTIPFNNTSSEELERRNIHKVDLFTIEKMRGEFEWALKKPCLHEWSDWEENRRECIKCGVREERLVRMR